MGSDKVQFQTYRVSHGFRLTNQTNITYFNQVNLVQIRNTHCIITSKTKCNEVNANMHSIAKSQIVLGTSGASKRSSKATSGSFGFLGLNKLDLLG